MVAAENYVRVLQGHEGVRLYVTVPMWKMWVTYWLFVKSGR